MTSASFAAPPGHAALISTRERHRVATLTVRDNALVSVRCGRKSVVTPSGALTVEPGAAVALPRGIQCDVINDPSGTGRYEALVLSFGDALIQRHDALPDASEGGAPPPVLTSARVVAADDELGEAVARAAATLMRSGARDALREHRLVEVLMLLSDRGVRFKAGIDLAWHERIRRLVAQRPQAEWDVAQVAQVLCVSASTLRRRLERESAKAPPARDGVAAIVREVRLETALGLLQATTLPVGEVAARCGWTSHSRFTAAFQSRWGFAPSLLRAPTAMREGERLTRLG